MNPRDLPHIDEFLSNIGRTEEVEQVLAREQLFTDKDLTALNQYLGVINFDQDRYAVWGRMLRNNQIMPMMSELALIYHLRQKHNENTVNIHEDIDGRGSTNFDAVVQLTEATVWIEITYEDLMEKLDEGPGFFDRKMTGYQIDNKIEKDFKSAKLATSENDLLVLALYMEAGPMQGISTGYRLKEGGKHNIPKFLDGFIQFEWIWDPHFEYIPFTEAGASVADHLV